MINMHSDINNTFAEYLSRGREFVSASVFNVQGHSPASEGSRMLVVKDGIAAGTVGGGAMEKDVIRKALELFSSCKSRVITYDLESGSAVENDEKTGMPCGGKVSVFLEYFGSPDSLYIFGCGHVGEALVNVLSGPGFSVNCIDEREEYAEKIKQRYHVPVFAGFPEMDSRRNTFIVIASYSHEKDYEILKKIIADKTEYEYLGIVASSGKWKTIKEKLEKEFGGRIDYSKIYSPAGLDTGGRTPADIAISIAAEINTVRYSISSQVSLRDKKRSE